jgi:fructose-specific phosphotransferase system IIA component
MKLSKIIRKEAVKLHMRSTDKAGALEELVDLLCAAYRLGDRGVILEAIRQRESKQSTGIGMGIAVPHAKTPAVKRLHVAFARHPEGLDFESIDGGKARFFFMLVSPRDTSGPHIQALAGISRLLKHDEFRSALMDCRTEADFIKLVKEAEAKYR